MTGPLERRAPAGPSALRQGLSAGLTSRIYLRVAAAASPSHGLCRPPLWGSSRLRRRGLPSEAGARPRAARTHTPTPRAPPPPAFRSASRTPRCPHWARAPRSPGFQESGVGKVCAPRHAPLLSLRAGEVGPGSEEATPRLGLGRSGRARPGPRAGPQQQVGARGARARRGHPSPFRPPADLPGCGQACESRRGRTPGASSWARAWGACGKRSALAGPRGGAARAGRPGVGPAGREAAPFVRVSEPCSRAVPLPRRPRRRAGCDHRGRRRPLPRRRGGISLKEASASLFVGRGRRESGAPSPARGGRDSGARAWPLSPAHVLLDGRTRGRAARGGGRSRWGRGWQRTRRRSRPTGSPVVGPADRRQPALGAHSPGQPGAVSYSGTRTHPSLS